MAPVGSTSCEVPIQPRSRIELPEDKRRKDREHHHRQATGPLRSAAIVVLAPHRRPANQPLAIIVLCALLRHVESSGGNPDRQCSSQPEALGAVQEETNGLKHSKKRLLQGVSRPCRLQRAVNTEQAPKMPMRKSTRHNNGEDRRREGRDETCTSRFRRGSGGGMHGQDSTCNKGSLPRGRGRPELSGRSGNGEPARASVGWDRWRMGP